MESMGVVHMADTNHMNHLIRVVSVPQDIFESMAQGHIQN